MTSSILEKIKLLPSTKQKEVEDFIDFLSERYLNTTNIENNLEKLRKKNAGRLSGKIKMSDDFNEIPKDFEEYS